MNVTSLIVRLNRSFAAHKQLGLWCVGILLASGLTGTILLKPVEDIASMIPNDGSRLAEDFRLIQKAPFINRALISVAAPQGTTTADLAAAGDALAAALPAVLFPEIHKGPAINTPADFVLGMLDLLPALFTEKDRAEVEKRLAPAAVRQSLLECVQILTSPEGLGMKDIIRRDPLRLRELALSKLANLRLLDSLRIEHGRFLSKDGLHMLIIARPAPAMTDSKGADQVVAAFQQARTALPPGYDATLIGGHRHTQANAAAIQSDMTTVLAASTLGLAVIFLVFLRSGAGFFAFLLPLVVLPPAALATRFVFGSISGITIGFGSVLMGVAADYSIYVYFSMRARHLSAATALGRVAAPVWYGAATSLVSFAALLFSAMPGVRELAFFALVGLVLALCLALVVLPCLIGPESEPARKPAMCSQRPLLTPLWSLILTVLTLVSGVCLGRNVSFDSDLHALSASGAAIKHDEAMLYSIWGGMHDKTMIFSRGASLDEALDANIELFTDASTHKDSSGLISLAPILPPSRVQTANIQRWRTFFTPERMSDLFGLVKSEASLLGFTPDAFEPLWEFLGAPAPSLATPEQLRAMGLGEVIDLLLTRDADQYLAISLTAESSSEFSVPERLAGKIRTISQSRFGRELTKCVQNDFIRFFLLSVVGNILLLYILLRSLRLTLISLLPTAVGLSLVFTLMGALGIGLNLFGVISLPLIIGIGVDYGIFIAMNGAGEDQRATLRSVMVAGLTTVVGFGALALARHPALHSIGLVVLIGISGAVLAACLLVAPLGKLNERRRP